MPLIRPSYVITSVLALALVLGLTGCGGSGERTHRFFYRVTNALSDIPDIDLQVDKKLHTAGMVYGDSIDYEEITTENEYVYFDIFEGGTALNIDSIAVQKQRDRSWHVFAIGVRNAGQFQPVARLQAIEITRTMPTGSNARIILVHGFARMAGTQTPKIDLLRSGQIQPVAEEVDFSEHKTFSLAAGTYDLTVRIAGLLSGELFDLTGVTFEAGKIYIVLLRGIEGTANDMEIHVFEEPVRIDP